MTAPAAAPPRIDPRIARRWVEVRREQGRHRLRILIVAASVVAALGLAAGSLYTPLLKVRHIRVSVSGAMTPAEVVAAAGLNHHTLMIDASGGAIARRLDAVPQLGSASVARQWPGTVRIEVVVRTAIVQVAVPGPRPAWATVDPTGRVLAVTSHRVAGLPLITGVGAPPAPGRWLAGAPGPGLRPGTPAASEVDMDAAADSPSVPRGAAAALAAVLALPAQVRAEVGAVTVGPGGSLALTVQPPTFGADPIAVSFGDGSQLGQKLTALATLLAQGNLSGVQAIDLTVPTRPAALTAR